MPTALKLVHLPLSPVLALVLLILGCGGDTSTDGPPSVASGTPPAANATFSPATASATSSAPSAGATALAGLTSFYSTGMFSSAPPPAEAGALTGPAALLAGGSDPVLSAATQQEFREAGLDLNIVQVTIWPVAGTTERLLVFSTDQTVQSALPEPQQERQAQIILGSTRMRSVIVARVARIVFIIRNFPEPGQTGTLTVTFTFLERLASGFQPTEADLVQNVFLQVK